MTAFQSKLKTYFFKFSLACLEKADQHWSILAFSSHVDKRYKTGLLRTMLHRAYALSSTTKAFNEEYAKLRFIFARLDYPIGLKFHH